MRRARRLVFALLLASLVHLSVRAGADVPDGVASAGASDLLAGLGDLLGEHGPPSVMVEPQRPERAEDRRAVALVVSRLADLGFRAVDGEAFRSRRREVADGADARGLDAGMARAALERIEADFVLRVSVTVSDAGSAESYGMRIERRGCVLAPTLLRVPDQAVLAVDAAAAESGSSSPVAAVESAQQSAASMLARSVAEAVVSDWRAVSEGRREWVVEIEGGDDDPRSTLESIGAGTATVLEHVPRGRTLAKADAPTVAQLRVLAGAERIRASRPGYVRLAPAAVAGATEPPARGLGGVFVIVAALLAVVLALAWSRRRAARASSSEAAGR